MTVAKSRRTAPAPELAEIAGSANAAPLFNQTKQRSEAGTFEADLGAVRRNSIVLCREREAATRAAKYELLRHFLFG